MTQGKNAAECNHRSRPPFEIPGYESLTLVCVRACDIIEKKKKNVLPKLKRSLLILNVNKSRHTAIRNYRKYTNKTKKSEKEHKILTKRKKKRLGRNKIREILKHAKSGEESNPTKKKTTTDRSSYAP